MQAKPYLRAVSLRRDNIDAFEVDPFNIPAIRELQTLDFHPDVRFFVGENGSGKSTELEAMAVASGFGPEGGTNTTLLKTADTVSRHHDRLQWVRRFARPRDGHFLRAESFYTLASDMEQVGDSGQ